MNQRRFHKYKANGLVSIKAAIPDCLTVGSTVLPLCVGAKLRFSHTWQSSYINTICCLSARALMLCEKVETEQKRPIKCHINHKSQLPAEMLCSNLLLHRRNFLSRKWDVRRTVALKWFCFWSQIRHQTFTVGDEHNTTPYQIFLALKGKQKFL